MNILKSFSSFIQIFATEDESEATEIVAENNTGSMPAYTEFIGQDTQDTDLDQNHEQQKIGSDFDEEYSEEHEIGYISEWDMVLAIKKLTEKQRNIFFKLTVMDNMKSIQCGSDASTDLFNEIKIELIKLYTLGTLHLSPIEIPLFLLARPKEWQADYIYKELVTIERVIEINMLRNNNDPITITLSDIITEINKKKALPKYYSSDRHVSNKYYESPQITNNKRSISEAQIINSLEIKVEHFFCNCPGSISFSCTESKTEPRKAISTKVKHGMCIFELDKTKIFTKFENDKVFDYQAMWYRYLPKSYKDLDRYRIDITDRNGVKRVRIEKNHITMILMGHMEAFIKQYMPTEELIKFNGDIYYYYFKLENWKKIEELIDRIIAPMSVKNVNIEMTPYGHQSWDDMLSDMNLLNVVQEFQMHQLEQGNKQQQKSSEEYHQVIDLSPIDSLDKATKVEYRNITLCNEPIDRIDETFEFMLTLEISYKIN